MARGLVVSSQSKATSHLLLSSIRKSSSLCPLRTSAFSTKDLRFSSPTPSASRLSCSCSYSQHDPVDVSRYREAFAERMAMAGLKPHHRIAIGVSGGPDSMALCLLAANWKNSGINAGGDQGSGFIDGLLAIIVDHGLRAESREEANTVRCRVLKMGIRCEIVHCEWSNGRPKKGHLQEVARERRYQIFQNVCIQHHFGVLLIAHHADDQAELFILRLSRNSGVLGLAGMAFISQLFSTDPYINGKAPYKPGILLVRPLLEFSKEDMYMVCKGSNQEWVEDPTNLSSMFARNRIRMALRKFSSSIFNSELQQVISACRRTRMYVDQVCSNLINQSVTTMAQGYAVIDLESLKPLKVKDICLSKFISLLLQFISQRHRPVRGSALKLLLNYFHTFPCKTSFTAAGCYLCPAPGSKGTKVLVCCSVNYFSALKIDLLQKLSCEGECKLFLSEVVQILADGKSYSDHSVIDASKLQFLDVTSSESVLVEARTLNILSESTYRNILSLQKDEIEHFRSKTEESSDSEMNNEVEDRGASVSNSLELGQYVYFMNRFLIKWEHREKIAFDTNSVESEHFHCSSCLVGGNKETKLRHMIDADWLYLAKLSQCHNVENFKGQRVKFIENVEQMKGKSYTCSEYAQKSAQRALILLKSIPVAARRGLPVLVNPLGLLLSIPSVGFGHCPCLTVSAVFMPKVPLGGGYSSFV